MPILKIKKLEDQGGYTQKCKSTDISDPHLISPSQDSNMSLVSWDYLLFHAFTRYYWVAWGGERV